MYASVTVLMAAVTYQHLLYKCLFFLFSPLEHSGPPPAPPPPLAEDQSLSVWLTSSEWLVHVGRWLKCSAYRARWVCAHFNERFHVYQVSVSHENDFIKADFLVIHNSFVKCVDDTIYIVTLVEVTLLPNVLVLGLFTTLDKGLKEPAKCISFTL